MMKKFTFKRQLLFVMLMLLGCLSIQAADDGLITNQVVITLDEPGTLPQKISASDKYRITNLKVKGDINGTDLGFLREMAGQSINGIDETNGKLSTLDLSDTKIVGGGEPYFNYGGYETYFTEYNKIGKYAFCSCNNLKRLTLPKDITSIEQSAFFGCSGLTSITIPSSVTAIGKWSFYDCSSLTSIELPNSTTTIDESAFQNCTSLASVTLTSNLTSIESYAFIGCSQLKDVRYNVLDDLATYIQTDHPEIYYINCDIKYYQNNQEITALKIPAGTTSIGKNVFQKYNGIQSLTFSPALTSISDLQFSCDFTNLKSVYVGWQDPIAAGTFFGDADMSNCTLYVPQGTKNTYSKADVWKNFGKIIEYNNQATITLEQPGTLSQKISDFDKNLITHLKIKGKINGTDIKFIREMAGVSVTGEKTDGELTNLDLSEAQIVSGGDCYYQDYLDNKHYTSDDELGVGFFSKCKGLKAITLPGNLKSVGESAFQECSCLETINLPSGITSIGNYAFLECENLTSVTLPSGLVSIGDRAFYGCISLTSLDLPSSLTTVGELALAGCSQLTSLTLHSGLTNIKGNNLFGENMFYNNLKDVRYIIDSDLETYLQSNHPIINNIRCGIKYYLNDQEITTLEIPSGITSIGDGVFLSSNSLTNLTLSSKVTSIGESAFRNCSNLKDVRYYIYDDLATYIQKGHPAFYVNCGIKYYWNNQEITTLEIPSSVTSIGNNAFYGCNGLTSVDLPSSITKMGECVFYNCQNLSSVKLPSEITAISNSAFGECISLKNIELPAGITSIGDDAFVNCSNLQNINLPSGITTIGTGAFWYCSNLTNVILPSALASIGAIAFANCSNLANVTLSSNITSIGYSAFSDCNSLKNLTISKDVTSIKDIRFYYEYDELELESVYVAWENPIEAGSFFDRIKISNCTLYVPQGTKEAYANADVWKDFGNIIEYDATGIDKVPNRSNVKEISRYSLNGQRVTSPTKGVNIVVYSDGSIKKVAVQ
nr:leucine-rich repeat domain-containing protein [Prevotella sp.]